MKTKKLSLLLLTVLLSVAFKSFSIPPVRYYRCLSFPTGSGCENSPPACGFTFSTTGNPCDNHTYSGMCGRDANGKEKRVTLNCNAYPGIVCPSGYPDISNISGPPILTTSKYKLHMMVYGKLSIEVIETGKVIEFLNVTPQVGNYTNQEMSITQLGSTAYKLNFTDYDYAKTISDQPNGINFFFTDAEIEVQLGLLPPESLTYVNSSAMYMDLQFMGEDAVLVGPNPANNQITITSDDLLIGMAAPKTVSIVPINVTVPLITVPVETKQTMISTLSYPAGYYRLIYKVSDYEFKNILIQISH